MPAILPLMTQAGISSLRGTSPRVSLSTGANWLLKLAAFLCFAMIGLVVLSDPRVMALLPGGEDRAAIRAETAVTGYSPAEARAGAAYLAMLGRFAGYTAGTPDVPVSVLPVSVLAGSASFASAPPPSAAIPHTAAGTEPRHKPAVSAMPTSRVKVRRAGQ